MADNKTEELVQIKEKLKKLIIERLSLEDMKPEDIKDNEALFGEGLGLDSLDAVEIAVTLQRDFGLNVKTFEAKTLEQKKEIFFSIDSVADYIYKNKTK